MATGKEVILKTAEERGDKIIGWSTDEKALDAEYTAYYGDTECRGYAFSESSIYIITEYDGWNGLSIYPRNPAPACVTVEAPKPDAEKDEEKNCASCVHLPLTHFGPCSNCSQHSHYTPH